MNRIYSKLLFAAVASVIVTVGPARAFHKGVEHGQGAGEIQTLDNLDCADGDFARLVSDQWECLGLAHLRAALGLSSTVFVTSLRFAADLVAEAEAIDAGFIGTALEAGDLLCDTRAAAAGLPGTYAAWLSTSTVDAKDRLTPGRVPIRRVDGQLVASDIGDLTNGTILVPISINEFGVEQQGAQFVYTGTLADGTKSGINCSDWATTDGFYTLGLLTSSSADWTQGATTVCFPGSRLYCFQM